MRLRQFAMTFLFVAVGVSCADPLTNLVTNGGFETGNFSGWLLSGNITPCVFVGTVGNTRCIPTTSIGPHSGTDAAELGNAGADASISQTLATTTGAQYEVSFWLASQNYGSPDNDFSVTFGGKTLFSQTNLAGPGYVFYDFKGLIAQSNSTTLSFTFHDTPSYLVLDDVSVVDPPTVPEPGAIIPLGVLLALASVWQYRRTRRTLQPAKIQQPEKRA